MKRGLLSLVLAAVLLLGFIFPAQAEQGLRDEVRARLEEMGFVMTEEMYRQVCQEMDDYLEMVSGFEGFEQFMDHYKTREYFAYTMLMYLGMGDYDWETFERTPLSDKIYAQDAEVFNIDQMYTEFLEGIDYIVPDAEFSEIEEDLSGLTDETDFYEGKRSVSFRCNGNAYEKELDSYGDWLNPEIIVYVNDVLKKEGCMAQLRVVSDEYDQIMMLIYGSKAEANMICRMIGVENAMEIENDFSLSGIVDGLLDWLLP